MRIDIKPLSVNQCWRGRRFKTDKYKAYEIEVAYKLKHLKLPKAPYFISYVFGFSNSLSDLDNPIKPFQDILQKYYGFDDRDIHKMTVEKVKVKKGKEFIEFEIKQLEL